MFPTQNIFYKITIVNKLILCSSVKNKYMQVVVYIDNLLTTRNLPVLLLIRLI